MDSLSDKIHRWHQRFLQQTRWTQAIASYLLKHTDLGPSSFLLEVGCGTGAVLQTFLQPLRSHYVGLDLNPDFLAYTALHQPNTRLIVGDAHQLPLGNACCDVCLCHFLLLWATDPFCVLREMCRVTRAGGIVMAIAEPDYGGRIDFPQELSLLGKWQMESLIQQGADPILGRQLRALFSGCGLVEVESGVLGGEWKSKFDPQEFNSEWDTLESDFANDPEKLVKLSNLKEADKIAYLQGKRILYTPTFYAWGRVV